MKLTIFVVFFFALSTLLGDCETQPNVGSEDVFELTGAQISVTEYSLESNALVARGTVRNGGSTSYSPPWYLEGIFYRDSTLGNGLTLGGTSKSFNFALGAGETTLWELRFTSTQDDVNKYPDFRVDKLRAYRN